MRTMTTWTNFAAGLGAAVTTWTYDPLRGTLTRKQYNDGNGPDYTYTPAGQLYTRAWARKTASGAPVTSTNNYNNAGELWAVNYNDGLTPGLTNSFDRLGRLASVSRGGVTTTYAYNLAEKGVGSPLCHLCLRVPFEQVICASWLDHYAFSILVQSIT
jgi:hypothetical protein